MSSAKIKDLKKYYEQKVSWSEEDGVFIVRFPELPGCQTHGKTREEAVANAEDALESHLSAIQSVEGKLPTPLAMQKEKKVALRMDPSVYVPAEENATRHGMSFNSYVNKAVEEYTKRDRESGRLVMPPAKANGPTSTRKRATR